MKAKLLAPLLLGALLQSALAKDYSAFFRGEPGSYIGYSETNPKGRQQKANPTFSLLHVLIPNGSKKATISFTYGTQFSLPNQTVEGAVVHRSKGMIAIICLPTKNVYGQIPDGIQSLVVYPQRGVGFLGEFSGEWPFTSADPKNTEFAAASLMRLREHKE